MDNELTGNAEKRTSWGTEGMALRDYFAAQAMAGYVSDPEFRCGTGFLATARIAYSMADAMLQARQPSAAKEHT